jgi:hypothetical protein
MSKKSVTPEAYQSSEVFHLTKTTHLLFLFPAHIYHLDSSTLIESGKLQPKFVLIHMHSLTMQSLLSRLPRPRLQRY